jgi:hypothetical protein
MKDPSKWVIPELPIRPVSTRIIQSIRLKKPPLDKYVRYSANKKSSATQVVVKTEYLACIVFKIDNNEDPVTHTLYANITFVTPPSCHVRPKASTTST